MKNKLKLFQHKPFFKGPEENLSTSGDVLEKRFVDLIKALEEVWASLEQSEGF